MSQYEQLGASATKEGLHQQLALRKLTGNDGLFAKVNKDLAGADTHLSFIHCDGAGTKSIIAYLHYKLYHHAECFRGIAQDSFVMNLDDVLCLGTPERLLLANSVARNMKLVPDEVIGEVLSGYQDYAQMLSEHGLSIELAGGETADCGDLVRTILIDSVISGRIAKSKLVNPQNIRHGDLIVGLSSTGQSSYEATENSGIGSNGITLARHTLLTAEYQSQYPEIGEIPRYKGKFTLSDPLPGSSLTIGQALLSPTRSYAPLLLAAYRQLGDKIHGVIHVTGGGLTKVLRFGSNNLYIKDSLFPSPPLFALIQRDGNIDWREMYQVFNMGHRIELYLDPEAAEQVIALANSWRIDAKIIGEVCPSNTTGLNTVIVRSEHGEFTYQL